MITNLRLIRPAKRLALLSVLLAATVAAAPTVSHGLPKIEAKRFKSSRTCTCHDEQVSDWRVSMHAKALYDPIYVLKKTQANKASKGELGQFCDTCHTPIGTMAGQTGEGGKLTRAGKEGVTCDFCHQVNGTGEPVGGASQTLKANGTKRAQYDDAAAPTHKTAYSEFHTTAEFCGSCHNLKHPTTGVPLDATYTEWKASPYSDLGIVCQDCHMSLTPAGGPSTGRAAALGPIRDFIYQMSFVGANVALGNPAKAVEMLKSAARISIEAPGVVGEGESAEVTVTVANVGAGHYIPGGAAEIRQMWLEVNAVAADGSKTLLGVRQFGTVFEDEAGEYPAQLWEAAAVRSDDRIPPKGSLASTYRLQMKTAEPLSVEAALYYKSFPDEMAKKARVGNPVTEMARATRVVHPSAGELRRATWAEVGLPGWLLYLIAGVLGILIVAAVFALVRRRRAGRADRPDERPYGG